MEEKSLHLSAAIFFGLLALAWLLQGVAVARGVRSLPVLAQIAPLTDAECPRVSILVAARDEAQKLPAALRTFLSLDYPNYEIIAVDDRSVDATGEILARASAADSRLKPLRIDTLPAGWLGKTHALQQAYEHSTGEWLVFTDGDVQFEPDLLRRTLALARVKHWDHLTLLGRAQMFTVGEKIAMSFFSLGFLLAQRPWSASNPKSSGYLGVGAFQQVRRSAYQQLGTHRRLALEVIDDLKLGKLAKEAGISSGAAKAGTSVSVHWHAGVANIIRGTTKNFFAAAGFSLPIAVAQLILLLIMFVVPVVSLPFLHGLPRIFALIAFAVPVMAEIGVCFEFAISPIYALTFPIGALIMAIMLARSTFFTLRNGGIEWRGTFYPLEELKRGVV